MKIKKSKTGFSAFQDYLGDNMSNPERNSFEKELEKSPFDYEAIEGLEQLDKNEWTGDINNLKDRLHKNRTFRNYYWPAAASVLLLISIGLTLLYTIKTSYKPQFTALSHKLEEKEAIASKNENKTVLSEPELSAGTTSRSEALPTTAGKKAYSSHLQAENGVKSKSQVPENKAWEQKSDTATYTVAVNTVDNDLNAIADEDRMDNKSFLLNSEVMENVKSIDPIVQDYHTFSGKIILKEENLPIPDVSVTMEGTRYSTVTDSNGSFSLKYKNMGHPVILSYKGMKTREVNPQKDTAHIFMLEPENLSLNEFVAIKKSSAMRIPPPETETTSADNLDLTSYLSKNAILPDNYPANRATVKLNYEINANGQAVNFKNTNKSDSGLFAKACGLIKYWYLVNNVSTPDSMVKKTEEIVFTKQRH